MQREGPLDTLTRGAYKGKTVEWLIRNNPHYFMSCVKEWLDISPYQAELFTRISQGGVIPERYIKEGEWTARDTYLYNTNRDIIPNHDWDDRPPEWWEEFKMQPEAHSSRPSQVVDLYEKYSRCSLRKVLKGI